MVRARALHNISMNTSNLTDRELLIRALERLDQNKRDIGELKGIIRESEKNHAKAADVGRLESAVTGLEDKFDKVVIALSKTFVTKAEFAPYKAAGVIIGSAVVIAIITAVLQGVLQ